jgi:hypothetical protein
MAERRNVVFGFWDRLESEIYKQNRSKAEIARKCHFDRKILSYCGNMSLPYFARICKELNVSADYLLFGK